MDMEKKKKRKKLLLTGLPVFLLCAVLLTLSVKNIDMVYDLLRSCVSRERVSFSGITGQIADAYQSDDLWGKNTFVDINGLYMRLASRRKSNGVNRMKNGMLQEYINPWNMEEKVAVLTDFSECLKTAGFPFLYIQAPGKVSLNKDVLFSVDMDYSNENADSLLAGLKSNGVHYLDLRPMLCADQDMVNQYFYGTDHHWTASGAFRAFQSIMPFLDRFFPESVDETYTDPKKWSQHTVSSMFLGSSGKRVGKYFGGVDDLVYYTPKFDTDWVCMIPNHQQIRSGTYEEVCIWDQYIHDKDYFENNNYYVYYGGDYPIMELRNDNAPNKKKIVLIKDSFSAPLMAFLQSEFRAVDAIDPRYYSDSTVMEYIYMNQPDMVIMMLNPSTLGNEDFFNNLGSSAFEENAQEQQNSQELFSQAEVRLKPTDNAYNSFKLPVHFSAGCVYTVSVSDIEVTNGDPEAIMLALYTANNFEFRIRKLWNLSHEGGQNGFTWQFMCPVDHADEDLEVRMYSGISGSAQGIGVVFKSVRVTQTYPVSGKRAIFVSPQVNIEAKPGNYNNVQIQANLTPGKTYEVTADDIQIIKGQANALSVGVYSQSQKKTIYRADLLLEKKNDGKYRWQFIIPKSISSASDCTVQFFAGLAGETENVEARVIHPVVYEVFTPWGREIYSQEKVNMAPDGNNYHSFAVPVAFEPGQTYTVHTNGISVTQGNTSGVTVALYRADNKTFLAKHNWYLNQAEADGFSWTFTVPRQVAAGQCQLLLYSGYAGEAKNKGLSYQQLSVYRWPDSIDDAIVYCQDKLTLEPSNNKWNCAVIPCQLLPGRTYRLTIKDWAVNAGSTDGITIKLRSEKEKRDLDEKIWWINNNRYTFEWIITIPDSAVGEDEISLQFCAGINGKTQGVGLTFSQIEIREIK